MELLPSEEEVREWLSYPVTRLLLLRLDEMRRSVQESYISCTSYEENRGRELQVNDVKELVQVGLAEGVR